MTKQEILDQIAESITSNGLQKINGVILNTILTAIAEIIPDETMLTSSFGGIIDPTSTIVVISGQAKWFFAKEGTYPNAGEQIIAPNKLGILSYDGLNWSKSELEIPGMNKALFFDPQNDNDALTGKITNEYIFGQETPVVANKNFGLSTNTSNTSTAASYVYWVSGNSFPANGTAKTLTIRCNSSGTLYVKAYSDNGSSYVYRTGSQRSFTVTVGLNTLDLSNLQLLQGDILFFGGVLIYYVANGSEGYSGILGTNAYAASATGTVAKSALSPSTAAIEFKINYDYTLLEANGGKLAKEVTPQTNDDKHWPSVKLMLETIGNSTVKNLTDIILIPSYGQSLSIGTDGGASTFASPVDIAYSVNNVNTNVQDMNGGYVETFKEMANHDNFTLPNGFKIMTCLGGEGGKSITELSKGSTYYTALMNNIQTAKNTASSLGKTLSVPAFCWTQGEEDYRAGGPAANYGTGNYVPTEYANKLKTLIDNINADVKAITGQSEDVVCVMYQVASHNTYTRYPRIALEQLKAAINNPRVILAKTMYDVEYNIADYVHVPNKTYRNMGNHYGIALYDAIVKGNHRLPIYPVKHQVAGNTIYIQFHVPVKPLVFDDLWVSPQADNNKGFSLVTVTNEVSTTATIAQSATTITNVELISGDTVKLTLSGAPIAGTRLTYGVNGNGWNIIDGSRTGTRHSGRTTGARGNLRDSQTYFNPVSDYFQLHNWCPIFEIIL